MSGCRCSECSSAGVVPRSVVDVCSAIRFLSFTFHARVRGPAVSTHSDFSCGGGGSAQVPKVSASYSDRPAGGHRVPLPSRSAPGFQGYAVASVPLFSVHGRCARSGRLKLRDRVVTRTGRLAHLHHHRGRERQGAGVRRGPRPAGRPALRAGDGVRHTIAPGTRRLTITFEYRPAPGARDSCRPPGRRRVRRRPGGGEGGGQLAAAARTRGAAAWAVGAQLRRVEPTDMPPPNPDRSTTSSSASRPRRWISSRVMAMDAAPVLP